MPELILIFVVALLVFGPKKLPEIGKSIGKGLAEFKRASDDLKKTIEQEIEQGKAETAAVRDQVAGIFPREAAPSFAKASEGEPAPVEKAAAVPAVPSGAAAASASPEPVPRPIEPS